MFGNRNRGKDNPGCGCQRAGAACDSMPGIGPDQDGDSFLSGAGRGCRCRIHRHHARGAVRQRLLDMGFIPNAEVVVLRVATLGDPMEVKVGDSLVTLRKHEAEQIEITGC